MCSMHIVKLNAAAGEATSMTNCAPFSDASKSVQTGDDDRTALAVRPGFYEAADLMRRIKMFWLRFLSRSNGPFSAARTGENVYEKSADAVRTRRVTNLMMTVDLLQGTTDEIGPNGPDGAELQGVGRQHQKASRPSGRTEQRCSTCITRARSRFRTTHRKAPFPTSKPDLNVEVLDG